MKKDRISYLIHRIRSQDATSDEKAELERFWQWAQHDDTLFNSLTDDEREIIRTEMLAKIRVRIAQKSAAGERRFLSSINGFSLKIAATISIVMLVSVVLYWLNRGETLTVSSEYGQLVEVVLPDNSRVTLNGNSDIAYAAKWGDHDVREIWLSGEAFFDVTHTKSDQKFIVHTEEGMDVEVLGTRFNVKIRRKQAQIMLEQGKVRLNGESAPSDTMTLKPGELATFVSGVLIKERVDPGRYSSWKEHRLYFDETPLSEVAKILEDSYGYKVSFRDEALAKRKLSGQIYSRKGSHILSAIEESLGVDVSIKGNRIIFAVPASEK